MSHLALILGVKRKIAANLLGTIKRHMLVHLAAFLVVIAGMTIGGFFFFRWVFNYLMALEVIGPPLMDHVVGMVFTAFFSMLIFSNLIVTLSTAYTSKEVDFLMAQPVERPTIFFVRLVETMVYSSWAFAVLSLPLFLAFGASRGVSPSFYAMAAALAAPFLLIPATLGSIATMVLSSLFPAHKTFRVAVLLGALGVAVAVLMVRMTSMSTIMNPTGLDSFRQIMAFLNVGAQPAYPSVWLLRGTLAAAEGRWGEFFYWLAVLGSTALFLLQVCAWLAPRIYYRGWRLAGESASTRRGVGAEPPRNRLDVLLRPLRPPIRAIVSKDIKTFWRDPAQWSQLMILFGLLFLYVANLRSVARYDTHLQLDSSFWKTLLSFFNLWAGCFMLSILTTRFVYPMLSLEGKQFWTLGLAPMRRETLVWEKYWLCWMVSFGLTAGLMLFSNLILRVNAFMMALSMAVVLVLSFGLTSISVGLGAFAPNFKEDNPARIANGLGGTMNVFVSLGYVASVIAIVIWPALMMETDRLDGIVSPPVVIGLSAAGLIAINAAAIIIPMRMGLRRWREMEF
jgi:ABC-2 type transport system permease protein